MKKIIIPVVSGLTLLIGLLSFSGMAMANDGITPANEGACDSLVGATPGLYGLCVAYCETQDLDTIDKKPPSIKILENYNKKKQSGDPDMPCVSAAGCFSDADLYAIDTLEAACTPAGLRFNDSVIQYGTPLNYAVVDKRSPASCGFFRFSTNQLVNKQNISDAQAQAGYDAIEAKCAALGQ